MGCRTSLLFLIILQIGYVAGVLYKLTEYHSDLKINPNETISINLCLYILNFVMITIDELLYLRNRRIEEKQ